MPTSGVYAGPGRLGGYPTGGPGTSAEGRAASPSRYTLPCGPTVAPKSRSLGGWTFFHGITALWISCVRP
ncbi:hypothetical protein ACIRL2_50170 [Embleya sp. NPDC127516]|uniref:hypothetical protein n=1 Tax=Embleya sp. NPDC127516 TaxID=3363990 RepID=UPI00381A0317